MNNILFKNHQKKNKFAAVLLHGRGSSADDIMTLSEYFPVDDFLFAAPQAPGNTWYPFSFLVPPEQNQPYLSESLKTVDSVINELKSHGINDNDILICGFSQGACLALEYGYASGREFGAVCAFSGGIISTDYLEKNSIPGTSVFLGCSENDPHIPVERVLLAEEFFKRRGADVNVKIYKNTFHSIIEDEIIELQKIVSKIKEKSTINTK